MVPFDVLDSIFSFLKSHPDSLVACSKAHPVFSRAVERHLYYHIRFWLRFYRSSHYLPRRTGITGYTLEPSYLLELLTESPHIVNYIRILQIDFGSTFLTEKTTQILQKITSMFSRLECMILMARSHDIPWKQLPQSFKEAIENCLRLSTLQRLHVRELPDFPLSILDKHVNINCFSLSGIPQISDYSEGTNPQLTALSFDFIYDPYLTSFIIWAKRHIFKLQSLKCICSNDKLLSELLEVCSETLTSLDLKLEEPYQLLIYDVSSQEMEVPSTPSINLSSLPHLQHLTIRGAVYHVESHEPEYEYYHVSRLPAVVEIFKTAPSLQHLIIDINVDLETELLSEVNFPFFAALAESSASFQHIDIYIHGLTTETIVLLLGEYGGVTALIEQGVVVIHMGETVPGDSRFFGPEYY